MKGIAKIAPLEANLTSINELIDSTRNEIFPQNAEINDVRLLLLSIIGLKLN